MSDLTTADFTALHHGLVRDWIHHGPNEVYAELEDLSAIELRSLVMLYVGRDALLSSR